MSNEFIKNLNCEGKNIYIIGGSGLIGLEVSKIYLKNNAHVIILDINKPKNYKNKNLSFINFDINNLNDFDFKNLFLKYGDPDIFINTSYPIDNNWSKCTFSKIKNEYLRSNVNLNLNSYVLTAIKFAEIMVKKKINGSILLMSSIYGFLGQDLDLYKGSNMNENVAYSVIKSGVINLVKQMSSYYAKHKIRINCVSPGGLYGHIKGKKNQQSKKFIKRYSKKTPLLRLGEANEVAKLILFLTTKNASYITGSNIIIDGGISVV